MGIKNTICYILSSNPQTSPACQLKPPHVECHYASINHQTLLITAAWLPHAALLTALAPAREASATPTGYFSNLR